MILYIRTYELLYNIFFKYLKNLTFLLDIELINIHGGSLRVYLKHYNNKFYIHPKLNNLLKNEINIQTDIKNLYKNIELWKKEFLNFLNKEKSKNELIIGYGASGRTNTILAYIDYYFDYIFDDSKYKINNYLPYFHTKILDSKMIYSMNNIKTIFIYFYNNIIKKHKNTRIL